MTRLLLVRHARPTENWDRAPDAGLDETGHGQARALADTLGSAPAVSVLTSPLRRARETAAPLAARWGTDAVVVPEVGEIAAPHVPAEGRADWLRGVLAGRWSDVDDRLAGWRAALLASLGSIATDSIVFTHFVAINTAVGAATGDDRVMCCTPAHASVTELSVDAGRLGLVALGAQAVAPMSSVQAPEAHLPRVGGTS